MISEKVEERVIHTKKEKLGVALEGNQIGDSMHAWRVNIAMLVRANWRWLLHVCTALAHATHHEDPFVVEGEADGEKVVEDDKGERLRRLQKQLRQEHSHVY